MKLRSLLAAFAAAAAVPRIATAWHAQRTVTLRTPLLLSPVSPSPSSSPARQRCARPFFITAAATTTTEAEASEAEAAATLPSLPLDREAMLAAAERAVRAAAADGVTRQRLRVLLPSPRVARLLVPPDETWEGGIMQLAAACSPVARDLVRRLSPPTAGVPPRLREQQLSVSGVDGESLWVSECGDPKKDVSCFVQPTNEMLSNLQLVCSSAKDRLVLMVNPQYKDTDDTLDFIAKAGSQEGSGGLGFFAASVANFLGGKAGFVGELDKLGFRTTFCLEQYVVRGSELKYLYTWGIGWQAFVTGDDGEPISLSGPERALSLRPDYNRIAAFLEGQGVAVKAVRDLGQAPPLTQASLSALFCEEEEY